MALEQKLHLKLSQKLVMTPSLQQAIKLLQLSKLELQEVVNQEVLENPLLEEVSEESPADEPRDQKKDESSGDDKSEERDSFDEIDFDAFFQDYLDYGYNPRMHEEREEFRIENTPSRQESLADHLTWQLTMCDASPRIREITTFLIGNVDDDGYLAASRDEVEEAGPYEPAEVEEAIGLLQSFDPLGIGALDLRECLLIQLAHLEVESDLAERIIRDYWHLFASRQFAQLARELGVEMKKLEALVEIIRRLDPRPGQKHSSERTIYVEPDVWVQKVGDDYVIMLNEDGMPRLRINRRYRRILHGEAGAVDGETLNYVKEKIRSAVWLIKSIDQRQRTIYKVAESIVKHQRDFLDFGIDRLRPMILRDVADDIQMHESTVSRVVANKYIHTPRGIFSMKYFFHSGIDSDNGADVSSIVVKRKIQSYIDGEDPKKPLSDSKIMRFLNREGINIARRTVAKYRDELRIPSSTDRKQVF